MEELAAVPVDILDVRPSMREDGNAALVIAIRGPRGERTALAIKIADAERLPEAITIAVEKMKEFEDHKKKSGPN